MYLQDKDNNMYATLCKYDWLHVTLSSVAQARALASTGLVLSTERSAVMTYPTVSTVFMGTE